MTRIVKPRKTNPKEDQEQIKLAVWLSKMGVIFTASANGGRRDLMTALKLKRMGVSAGFPDVFIPYPLPPQRGGYSGLFLELKRVLGGVVSEAQKEWLSFLNRQGYKAVVARGFEEAKKIVIEYLALEDKVC